MIEDELLFAWLDGELDGDEAQRVGAAVAASPELAATAERHRRLQKDLSGAFDPVMQSPAAPPRFEASEVIDFSARPTARDRRRSWLAAPQLAAMAASLAIGLLIGTQLVGDGNSPVSVNEEGLVAAAALDEALDTRLASVPANTGARIGLTFRDATGRICRSFMDREASGLACRAGGDWQIRGLFAAPEGQAADYRMAAGGDPRLAALIDESIAGEPFDAAQEKAALRGGWR